MTWIDDQPIQIAHCDKGHVALGPRLGVGIVHVGRCSGIICGQHQLVGGFEQVEVTFQLNCKSRWRELVIVIVAE